MCTNATDDTECIDVDPRTRRALAEPLSVVTLDGTAVEDRETTMVMVVSHSGDSYHVDVREGRCTCPDHEHRGVECKHIRRARVALGTEPVDSRVLAAVDVDDTLGASAPGPVVATSDGGIIEAGDDGQILDDGSDTDSDTTGSADDGRPDECDCGGFHTDTDLPCWPCYREGYETPARDD